MRFILRITRNVIVGMGVRVRPRKTVLRTLVNRIPNIGILASERFCVLCPSTCGRFQ